MTTDMVGLVGTKWHRTIDSAVCCSGVRRQTRARSVKPRNEVPAANRCAKCAGGTAGPAKTTAPTTDNRATFQSRIAAAAKNVAAYEDMLAGNADNLDAVADLTPKLTQAKARHAEEVARLAALDAEVAK